MKNFLVLLTAGLMIVSVAGLANANNQQHVAFGCGFKPFVPFGCSDLVCLDGRWVCVGKRWNKEDRTEFDLSGKRKKHQYPTIKTYKSYKKLRKGSLATLQVAGLRRRVTRGRGSRAKGWCKVINCKR